MRNRIILKLGSDKRARLVWQRVSHRKSDDDNEPAQKPKPNRHQKQSQVQKRKFGTSVNGNTRTRAPVCDIHDNRQSPLGTSSRLSHMLVNQSEMTPLCMRPMGKRERISTAPETWKHSRSTTRVPNEHPIAKCKTEGRMRVQREQRGGVAKVRTRTQSKHRYRTP